MGRVYSMPVHDLHKQLRQGNGLTVLDVRTEKEWDEGHIEGALHIHGGTLQERVGEVPQDKPVAVVCGSGYRASIAASFLKRGGYGDVTNVLGGMSAWNAAKLPTTTISPRHVRAQVTAPVAADCGEAASFDPLIRTGCGLPARLQSPRRRLYPFAYP